MWMQTRPERLELLFDNPADAENYATRIRDSIAKFNETHVKKRNPDVTVHVWSMRITEGKTFIRELYCVGVLP